MISAEGADVITGVFKVRRFSIVYVCARDSVLCYACGFVFLCFVHTIELVFVWFDTHLMFTWCPPSTHTSSLLTSFNPDSPSFLTSLLLSFLPFSSFLPYLLPPFLPSFLFFTSFLLPSFFLPFSLSPSFSPPSFHRVSVAQEPVAHTHVRGRRHRRCHWRMRRPRHRRQHVRACVCACVRACVSAKYASAVNTQHARLGEPPVRYYFYSSDHGFQLGEFNILVR